MRKSGLTIFKHGSDEKIVANTDPQRGVALIGIQPLYLPLHIMPLNDLKPHSANDFYDCACNPDLEVSGLQFIVVHQAYDGRK